MNFRPFNIGVTVVAVPFAVYVAVTDIGRLPQAAPGYSRVEPQSTVRLQPTAEYPYRGARP